MKIYKSYIIAFLLSLFFIISCSDNEVIPEVKEEQEQGEQEEEQEELVIADIDFEIAKRYALPDSFILGNDTYNIDASSINLLISVVNKPIVDNSVVRNIPDGSLVTDVSEEPITLKNELVAENDTFLITDIFTTKLTWGVEAVFNVSNTIEAGETENYNLLIDKKVSYPVSDSSDVYTTVISWKTKKGDIFEGAFFLNENNEETFKNTWNEVDDVFSINYTAYNEGVATRNLSYMMRKDKSGKATDTDNKIEYSWTPEGVITITDVLD